VVVRICVALRAAAGDQPLTVEHRCHGSPGEQVDGQQGCGKADRETTVRRLQDAFKAPKNRIGKST
jgi:hypothetical protein